MYLIDSYAWIEYFKGTREGKKASPYIEGGDASTTTVTIAELAEKYKRENLDFKKDLQFILSKVRIINLDFRLALAAGKINAERKKFIKGWGMSDSIILTTAHIFNLKIITGDKHFKDLKEAIMIS